MVQLVGRFVGMLAGLLMAVPVVAAPLKSVDVHADAGGARVDLVVPDGKLAAFTFALDGPRRLVIDLPGVSTASTTWNGGGPVTKARAAQFSADTARVVLDLASPAKLGAHVAADGRLSLTIVPVDNTVFTKLVAAGRVRLDAPKAAVQKLVVARVEPPVVKLPNRPPARVAALPSQPRPPVARPRGRSGLPVVVIDAGHGGKDVGAVSVLGARRYEKEAVLAIARAIKKELDASGRVRTILTRTDDTYLRLRDRFELARRNRAELFISVHADSAPVPVVSGATVYTLSETASDAEAARLAAKENRSDIIAGVDLGIETSEVSDILIDLAQRETMNTSAAFAAVLQRELRQDIRVRSQFHRFAGFLVLKAPDVPSVLLETGYLSNEDDSIFLFSPSGQARIAKGVRRAVEAHFLRRLAQR